VRAAAAVEAVRRSFGVTPTYEGALADGSADQLVGVDVTWSATRVETYRSCAFRFFGGYALGLHELEDEMETADAATRGSVIHAVLEAAVAPLAARRAGLNVETLPEVLQRLWDAGAAIWRDAPQRYGFGRQALWRLEWADVAPELERLLRAEAAATLPGSYVFGTEHRATVDLALDPPLRVMAGIDRLDFDGETAVVVDYKSGRVFSRNHVSSGERVQLPLYGLVARHETGASRVIARYAWTQAPLNPLQLDSANESDEALLDSTLDILSVTRAGVAGGDFRVNPQTPTCPTYCEMRHVCRVNQFSRWKWQ
jgi:RecB family exonuclease